MLRAFNPSPGKDFIRNWSPEVGIRKTRFLPEETVWYMKDWKGTLAMNAVRVSGLASG